VAASNLNALTGNGIAAGADGAGRKKLQTGAAGTSPANERIGTLDVAIADRVVGYAPFRSTITGRWVDAGFVRFAVVVGAARGPLGVDTSACRAVIVRIARHALVITADAEFVGTDALFNRAFFVRIAVGAAGAQSGVSVAGLLERAIHVRITGDPFEQVIVVAYRGHALQAVGVVVAGGLPVAEAHSAAGADALKDVARHLADPRQLEGAVGGLHVAAGTLDSPQRFPVAYDLEDKHALAGLAIAGGGTRGHSDVDGVCRPPVHPHLGGIVVPDIHRVIGGNHGNDSLVGELGSHP
jgi:hypothetical protein